MEIFHSPVMDELAAEKNVARNELRAIEIVIGLCERRRYILDSVRDFICLFFFILIQQPYPCHSQTFAHVCVNIKL